MDKNPSFNATVELDREISRLISFLTKKHEVHVNMDSDYTKGTIRIKIKD